MPWIYDGKARMLDYLVENEVRYRFPAPTTSEEGLQLVAQVLLRNRDIPRDEVMMLSAMLLTLVDKK